jgi:anti-sigma factor RsiW
MRVGRLLQAYLDDELNDEQAAALVARHLEACRRCGLEAAGISALKAGLTRLRDEPSADRVQRLEQLVEEIAATEGPPPRFG